MKTPTARITAKPGQSVEKVDWLPSRWDRSGESLHDVMVRSKKDKVSMMGTSEVDLPGRWDALQLDGYRTLHDTKRDRGYAECAVLIDRDVWEVLFFHSKKVGPDLGPGGFVNAIAVGVRHKKSGKRMIASFAHLPASVESDLADGKANGQRAKEYKKAVRAWKRWLRLLGVRHGIWKLLMFADWNINIKREQFKEYIKETFPRMRLPKQLTEWTHAGGRLIDFCLARGVSILKFRALKEHRHSDHRGVRAWIAF